MSRPAERVVAFYNKRGTCEQWIKEGKGAIKWTRLSCRTFAANAVRLQLHALAYNLGNYLRTLATPEPIKDWSLTSLKDKLIKIGAKVVSHGRYVIFQMAEVAIARQIFQEILRLIAELRPQPPPAPGEAFDGYAFKSNRQKECVPNARENHQINPSATVRAARCAGSPVWLPKKLENRYYSRQFGSHLGNVGLSISRQRKSWASPSPIACSPAPTR